MLNANGLCFVSNSSDSDQPILYPGKVTDADSFFAELRFDTAAPLPKTGNVIVFADWRGKFYRQNCKIVSTKSAGGRVIINTERVSEPVPVETTVDVRINVEALNITLSIGKQINCPLFDLGEEGLTVIAQSPLKKGEKVDVNFTVDSIYGVGYAIVDSEIKLPNGKTGYSLTFGDKKNPLRKSSEALANVVQRRQLRTLAAA